jgi:hypothetical protein
MVPAILYDGVDVSERVVAGVPVIDRIIEGRALEMLERRLKDEADDEEAALAVIFQ